MFLEQLLLYGLERLIFMIVSYIPNFLIEINCIIALDKFRYNNAINYDLYYICKGNSKIQYY